MNLTVSLLAGLAKLISGASMRWIDCQPDTCQRVYFANHTSHLDALVLWASLPRHVRAVTRPVAAKDYWDRDRLRRYISRQFNALLIDRREIKVHQSPVDLVVAAIGDVHSLIVFRKEAGAWMESWVSSRVVFIIWARSVQTWNSCPSTLTISTAFCLEASSCQYRC